MDAVTLDGLLGEIAPRLVGRHIARPRLAGSCALEFEISAERELRLRLDASRVSPGIYWIAREKSRALAALEGASPSGRAQHALLSFRKHADGVRVHGLRRLAGTRTLVLDAGDGVLVLRLGGAAPVLSLIVDGRVVASLGDGVASAAVDEERPDLEWTRLVPEALARAVERARQDGGSTVRAVLDLVPGLGPRLARQIDESPESAERLLSRLAHPSPTLVAPGPPEGWEERDLVAPSAVALLPCAPPEGSAQACDSWSVAATLFLEARLRGLAFEVRRRRLLEVQRQRIRKQTQLLHHLQKDVLGLDDESSLRHDAEALLVSLSEVPRGSDRVVLADPRDPERRMEVRLDPRLSPSANAERLFERARRVERARRNIAARTEEARLRLREASQAEEAILGARGLRDLPADETAIAPQREAKPPQQRPAAGPLHFLSSRGLSLLVGRGARENHELTFGLARPEDHWFHARDVPGAHVILRDREGRANAQDLREAAELAAFYSEARDERAVDVHATRRKHIRPGRGGPGRVTISHSETIRVAPSNPEGRLRRR